MAVPVDSRSRRTYWAVLVFVAAFSHVNGFLTSRACVDDVCEHHSLTCPGSDKIVIFDVLTNYGSGLRPVGPYGNLSCHLNNVTSTCRQGDVTCPKLSGSPPCAVCEPNDVCLFTPTARAQTSQDVCYQRCTFLSTGSDINFACLTDVEADDAERTASGSAVYISHAAITSAPYSRGHVCGVESGGTPGVIVTLSVVSRDCSLATSLRSASSTRSLPCNVAVKSYPQATPFLVTMEAAPNVNLSEASGYVVIELQASLGQTIVVSCQSRSEPDEGSTTPVALTTTAAIPGNTSVTPVEGSSSGNFSTTDAGTAANMSSTSSSTTSPVVSAGGMTQLNSMYLAIGVLGLLLCVIAVLIIAFACRLRATEKQKRRNRRHFINLDLSPIESRDVPRMEGGQRYDEVEISTENHYATPELVPRAGGDGVGDDNSGSVYFVLEKTDSSSGGTSRPSRSEESAGDVDTAQAVYATLEPDSLGGAGGSPAYSRRLSTFKPSPPPSRSGMPLRASTVVPTSTSLHHSQSPGRNEPYDLLGHKREPKLVGGKHVYDHLSVGADGSGTSQYHHLTFEPQRSGIITDNPYHVASVIDGQALTPHGGNSSDPEGTPSENKNVEASCDSGKNPPDSAAGAGAGAGSNKAAAEADTSSLAASDVLPCDELGLEHCWPRPRRKSDSTVLEDKDLSRLLAGRSGRRHSAFTVRRTPLSSDLSYLEHMAVSESGFSDSGREPSLSSLCVGEAADDDANEVDISIYIA